MASRCSYRREVADASAEACAVEPRSCRECLNEPLDTGEVCALSPLSGLCVPAAAVTSGTPLFSGVRTAAEPLLSNASTYCGAEDGACAACLAQTRASGAVCTGADGCVCVGVCERDAEARDATATLLLSRLLDGQPRSIGGGLGDDGSAASDCASTRSEPREPLMGPYPPPKSGRASDNACMWHEAAEDQCSRPRSCYECLNVALESGQECTITPQGYCSTMDAYEWARDFRLNGSASAKHYFPSRNSTYCEPSDATCAACARGPFVVSDSGRIHASQFCVGERGCVCVGFCESRDYGELVRSRMCDGPVSAASSAAADAESSQSMLIVAYAIAASALMLVSLSLWLWRRARTEARGPPADRSREPRPPKFGPPLALTAWKERRDELIARETAETVDAPPYDSPGCFYLTTPTSTPIAVLTDEHGRDRASSSQRSFRMSEHEREAARGDGWEPHVHGGSDAPVESPALK